MLLDLAAGPRLSRGNGKSSPRIRSQPTVRTRTGQASPPADSDVILKFHLWMRAVSPVVVDAKSPTRGQSFLSVAHAARPPKLSCLTD